MNNLSVYFLCQHHNKAHAQVQGGKSAQNSHYHKHNRTKNLTHFFFTPLSADSLRNAFFACPGFQKASYQTSFFSSIDSTHP